MCYYLYAGVNASGYNEEFKNICRKHNMSDHETITPAKDKNMPLGIEKDTVWLEITGNYCDCDTSIGENYAETDEIKRFLMWFRELKSLKKIKYIYFGKLLFSGCRADTIERMVPKINIAYVNKKMLSRLETDTLYKILNYNNRIQS